MHMTNSKIRPNALIWRLSKKWHTLDEVTKKWSELAGRVFTDSDVLHFGIQGILVFNVILNLSGDDNKEIKNYYIKCLELYSPLIDSEKLKAVEKLRDFSLPLISRRFWQVKPRDLERIAIYGESPGAILLVNGIQDSTPTMVRKNDLIIMGDELKRFEKISGLMDFDETNIPASTIPDSTTSTERAQKKSGRPKDPSALTNNLGELKADAIKAAHDFIKKNRKNPSVDDIAKSLARSDKWCSNSYASIKPHLRASWWK